jgi:L-ribulose-5-phosphate 4-epimerase
MNYRKFCLEQNRRIPSESLAKLTWGNFSVIDREESLVYIKPSGVDLSTCSDEDISVISVRGDRVSGLKPSVDTKIHLELYDKFTQIKSVCHTHSPYAVAFAQSGLNIEVMGTTHSDLSKQPISNVSVPDSLFDSGLDHELELGRLIARSVKEEDAAVLLRNHGPFVWSRDFDAIDVAVAVEEIAKMAFLTLQLGNQCSVSTSLKEFHWNRKHGRDKSYGQDRN